MSNQHGGVFLEMEEIKALIKNAHIIKREGVCIECQGTGHFTWNEETGVTVPGYTNTWDRDDALNCYECTDCQGIGYNWQDFLNKE